MADLDFKSWFYMIYIIFFKVGSAARTQTLAQTAPGRHHPKLAPEIETRTLQQPPNLEDKLQPPNRELPNVKKSNKPAIQSAHQTTTSQPGTS